MDWGTYIFEWAHVFSGTLWFGSFLYITMVLAPSIRQLPPARSGYAMQVIAGKTSRVMASAGWATVILGVVRGTFFGRLDGPEALSTRYGIVWLISLALGLVTVLFGQFITGKRVHAMADFLVQVAESGAQPPPPGSPPPPPAQRLKQASMISMVLFLALFTCMVILNFS